VKRKNCLWNFGLEKCLEDQGGVNIEMNLKEIGCEVWRWIFMTEDLISLWAP
jgi:hypothetical protein